ncbi:hypothetical protein K440DRAFT_640797 [Wilcoxina mikolae CBS 423.85]|nr:hypothetical protein K440DRAFT_640797 [Wilcoxina mikolae CBS 423.85]
MLHGRTDQQTLPEQHAILEQTLPQFSHSELDLHPVLVLPLALQERQQFTGNSSAHSYPSVSQQAANKTLSRSVSTVKQDKRIPFHRYSRSCREHNRRSRRVKARCQAKRLEQICSVKLLVEIRWEGAPSVLVYQPLCFRYRKGACERRENLGTRAETSGEHEKGWSMVSGFLITRNIDIARCFLYQVTPVDRGFLAGYAIEMEHKQTSPEIFPAGNAPKWTSFVLCRCRGRMIQRFSLYHPLSLKLLIASITKSITGFILRDFLEQQILYSIQHGSNPTSLYLFAGSLRGRLFNPHNTFDHNCGFYLQITPLDVGHKPQAFSSSNRKSLPSGLTSMGEPGGGEDFLLAEGDGQLGY